jgi:hypothetical protein
VTKNEKVSYKSEKLFFLEIGAMSVSKTAEFYADASLPWASPF